MSVEGEKTCSHCGASMQGAQDWCLQCGSGAPREAGTGPGWRSAALAIGATGALALGASAAAYAALQQRSPVRRATSVAQTPPATTTTTSTAAIPPPSTAPSPTPMPGGTAGDGAQTPSLRTPSAPPKIPGTTPTPSGRKSKTSTVTESSTTTTTSTSSSSSSTAEQHEDSHPILLDTDAAKLYDPEKLAASRFGDPSLAIDGDSTTAWTVQLEPAQAPALGAGLTLDLNAPLSVAQLTLITESVGITVQIYGTTSAAPPESLSSEGWVRLSKRHLVKKRKATIELSEAKKRFRQLLLWIVKAPTASSGQITGSDVAIDEIQLYEPKR